MKAKDFEATSLLKGTRKHYILTAKEDVGNNVVNDNGAYLVAASATRQFTVNVYWLEGKREVDRVHMVFLGEYYFKNSIRKAYKTAHVNKDSVYSLSRY